MSAFISHMKSEPRGLLARWYLSIARFLPKMQLEYKPGLVNVVADCLSRAPVSTDKGTVLQISEGDKSLLQLVEQEQRQDQELAQLMDYL